MYAYFVVFHQTHQTIPVCVTVKIGKDTSDEPVFQYIPDTHYIYSTMPPGGDSLAGSLMLLQEGLESGIAQAQFEVTTFLNGCFEQADLLLKHRQCFHLMCNEIILMYDKQFVLLYEKKLEEMHLILMFCSNFTVRSQE